MKNIVRSISKIEIGTLRDAFIVMGAISLILLGVQILEWMHLIKNFDWN